MAIRPFVSVVIPCRNERKHINRCLDSVIENDFPKEDLEILVVDGMSSDGTRDILAKYCEQYPFIHMLDNAGRITPKALNTGVRAAKGEIIVRMDAHTTYAPDYVSRCVNGLQQHGADNVGGVWVIEPTESTVFAEAIGVALAHPFGVGNAHYRLKPNAPMEVDTVPFGCYRRQVFERVGYFNEDLRRGQDMDFNVRLAAAGGRILLLPDVVSYYHPRTRWSAFVRHNLWNGIWVCYPLRYGSVAFSLRHLVPGAFVLFLLTTAGVGFVWVPSWLATALGAGAYAVVAMIVSVSAAYVRRKPGLLLTLPLVFASLHLAYGIGTVTGALGVVWSRGFWRTVFKKKPATQGRSPKVSSPP